MAANLRSVRRVIGLERQFFAARGTGFAVEPRRYVRGLRRKPVRVIVPESEPDKVPQQPQPGGQNMGRKTDAVMAKNNVKVVRGSVTKDQMDALRYETALPGDKRLG